MAKVSDDAVLAIYLDKNGREIQWEALTDEAKTRELQQEIPVQPPYTVMTVELSCLTKDRAIFAQAITNALGPAEDVTIARGWYYAVQNNHDDRVLRYVFDTQHEVPLHIFAEIIRAKTLEDPSRCQTVRLTVCGGCVWPCRPKTCNGKASCGWASGCPC